MPKLGRVRQETRFDPGPLNHIDHILLCIRQIANFLEAVLIRAGQPSTMLKVPVSSQATNQIFK